MVACVVCASQSGCGCGWRCDTYEIQSYKFEFEDLKVVLLLTFPSSPCLTPYLPLGTNGRVFECFGAIGLHPRPLCWLRFPVVWYICPVPQWFLPNFEHFCQPRRFHPSGTLKMCLWQRPESLRSVNTFQCNKSTCTTMQDNNITTTAPLTQQETGPHLRCSISSFETSSKDSTVSDSSAYLALATRLICSNN